MCSLLKIVFKSQSQYFMCASFVINGRGLFFFFVMIRKFTAIRNIMNKIYYYVM